VSATRIPADSETLAYFRELEAHTEKVFAIAQAARLKNLDPTAYPEVQLALDLAERVEKLVGPEGVAQSIRQLQVKGLKKEEIAFQIAERIIYNEYKLFGNPVEAADNAIRTAIAILTDGITAAPLEGIDSVKIKKNADDSRYLSVYYAGPIRSAGGTEQALSVLIADQVRRLLGLERYKPTEAEIRRYVEELRLYESRVSRFQYHATDAELIRAVQHIPVEINGVQTDDLEVSVNRDLPRIETNRVRGGGLRVLNDGVLSKASKLRKIIEKMGLAEWSWLRESETKGDESQGQLEKIKPNFNYLHDSVAGRIVISYPSEPGGLRLRYGRSRNTGLAAVGMHPATMKILNDFVAIGTQLRVERPGKSAVVTSVHGIEGPIVRLRDGTVMKLHTASEAEHITPQLDKILYLGDLLVAFGEFLENSHPLMPSGYCEEWWQEELRAAILRRFAGKVEKAAETCKITPSKVWGFLDHHLMKIPSEQETLLLARTLGVPIHPEYNFFWERLGVGEYYSLSHAFRNEGAANLNLRSEENVKGLLEKLGVEHSIQDDLIVITSGLTILRELLASEKGRPEQPFSGDVIDLIRERTGLRVRAKAPTSIGVRVGRPEKSKERKLKPPVHLLFPVGNNGGPSRDLMKAVGKGFVEVEIITRRCSSCGTPSLSVKCYSCGNLTEISATCLSCNISVRGSTCPRCHKPTRVYSLQQINLTKLLENAFVQLGTRDIKSLKGVKGLSSRTKTPEPLTKGILRAKHKVFVYKDGTVRFDIVNAPLTHFKPAEIGLTAEQLQKVGYRLNVNGMPISSLEEIIELKPQDIIIPRSCGRYLVRVAHFIDELLSKIYGIAPFYNISKIEELIGHLIVGLAPHTSSGTMGRIIGFTDCSVCFAHPYWHQAKRRNCDGDEDAVMLALDAFLNFSKSYLPKGRGGLMDTPVIVMTLLNPAEVDDEVYNMENVERYDLEFYEATLTHEDPKRLVNIVETIGQKIGKENQFTPLRYSHSVESILDGTHVSTYKALKTMEDKVKTQLSVEDKIQSVNVADIAERLLSTHFLRDLLGNLRAFTSQTMRCSKCTRKYRRIPLKGTCTKCGGNLILSVHEKSVRKYLASAHELVERYQLNTYMSQRVQLADRELEALFKDDSSQSRLSVFIEREENAGRN
jgi:DNA polymerase II large subunit